MTRGAELHEDVRDLMDSRGPIIYTINIVFDGDYLLIDIISNCLIAKIVSHDC